MGVQLHERAHWLSEEVNWSHSHAVSNSVCHTCTLGWLNYLGHAFPLRDARSFSNTPIWPFPKTILHPRLRTRWNVRKQDDHFATSCMLVYYYCILRGAVHLLQRDYGIHSVCGIPWHSVVGIRVLLSVTATLTTDCKELRSMTSLQLTSCLIISIWISNISLFLTCNFREIVLRFSVNTKGYFTDTISDRAADIMTFSISVVGHWLYVCRGILVGTRINPNQRMGPANWINSAS